MEKFRRNCILLMLLFFLLGSMPPLMGWYNRSGMILGIPSFLAGFLLTIFGMLFSLLALYLHDAKKDESEGKEGHGSCAAYDEECDPVQTPAAANTEAADVKREVQIR